MKKIEIALTLDDCNYLDEAIDLYIDMKTPPTDPDEGGDEKIVQDLRVLSDKIAALRGPLKQEDA